MPHQPKAEEILRAVEAIVQSEGFRRSDRMSRFLRHVVQNALANDQGQLKESAIGHAVFDRPADYDTKQDPVVRNEARRLRAKLDHFYQTEGGSARVRIEIPRGGYAPQFALQPGSNSATDSRSLPASRRVVMLVLTGFALAGLVGLYWMSRTPDIPVFGRIRPLSSTAESELHATFDRQGRWMAYCSNAKGNFDIYLRDQAASVRRVTRHEADELHPSFLPDGSHLVFGRVAGGGFDIVVVNLQSGEERTVARSEGLMFGGPVPDPTEMFGNPGPVWSPDGTEIAFTTVVGGESQARAIHLVKVRGGGIRQLTHPPGQRHDLDPAFSPDGTKLVFSRWLTNSSSEIFVASVKTGEARRLTAEQSDHRGFAWMPDGKSLVVSSNRSGLFGLWHLSIDGGTMRPLALSAGHARDPALSKDGTQLVFSEYRQQSEIWRSSTVFHSKGRGIHERIVESARQNHSAQISPDGKQVAYVSDRSGSWEIWVQDLATAQCRKVTHFEGPMVGSVQWAPDGKTLAFDARPQGRSAIFLVDLEGDREARVWSQSGFEDKMPSWSEDGRWLLFNSDRGGRQQLWKAPVTAPGNATLLSAEFAVDSRQAREAVIYESSMAQLWLAPVLGGPAHPVPHLPPLPASRLWTGTSEGIWTVDTRSSPPEVWLADPATGASRPAAILAGPVVENTPSLSISPLRDWVVYSLRKESRSQLLRLEAK